MFNVIDSFLLKYIRDGGPVMYALVFASIIALGYTIERWWALHKAKINTAEFTGKLRTVLLKKDVKGAVRLCENYRGPIASIWHRDLATGVETQLTATEPGRPPADFVAPPIHAFSWFDGVVVRWTSQDGEHVLVTP